MKHYSLHDWIEFVREVKPPAERTAMQAHLTSGCKKCRKTKRVWQSVVEIGGREEAWQPPTPLVRTLRGYYGLFHPQKRFSKRAQFTRLVFDSLRQSVAAGQRASSAPARQLCYAAGGLSVDMRIERGAGPSQAAVTGQVLDLTKPGGKIFNASVILIGKEGLIKHTATNQFGEFYLEFELKEKVELRVCMPGRGPIVIPLEGIGPRELT